MRPVPALSTYAVEWADEEGLLLSRGRHLYAAEAPDARPRSVAKIPAPLWKAIAAHVRPLQRLMRFQFYNVLKLSDGSLFVTFDRCVGVIRNGEFEALRGLRRACRVLRGACALGADGNVYFGEYFRNTEREPVCIYRYRPGAAALETAHNFHAGEVRHVHGIYRDPHDDRLWCLTGDREDECRFTTSVDGFRSVDVVGRGDETWRSVSLQFSRDYVYYGTDAEFQTNYLYRIRRAGRQRERLCKIDGPVYYSHAVGGDLFFAVTAELCPSQQSRTATLWHVTQETSPTQLISFEKDRWPVRYFQAGILNLSHGPSDGEGFYLHGQGLMGADNRTFRVEMS